MLSSYETGRQRPSLDTLEKILATLGSDLNDLHNAIQIVNGRPEGMRRRPEAEPAAGAEATEGASGVRAVLGVGGNLPPEVEESFVQMLEGFHRFLRYLLERLQHAEA
jgi:transcriptional regulator with XRE-family HTH domain